MVDDSRRAHQQLAFLVVGMARSGTTLIQRLVSELRDVWVPQETHFWRHAALLANKFPPPLDRARAHEAISWFLQLPSSAHLPLDPDRIAESVPDECYLWDLFDALVCALSPPGKTVIGEKTPDHLRWCEQLLGAKSQLKVVGLVRDPREVFRSHQSVPWGLRDPYVLAEKWLQLSRALRDCEKLFTGRVLTLRYEDVATDPTQARSAMAAFLGVANVTDPHFDSLKTSLFPREEWWKARALGSVVSPIQEWPDRISESDVRTIDHRCREEMATWGYEIVDASPTDQAPSDSVFEVRRATNRASVHPLPITVDQLEAWKQAPSTRAQAIGALQRELASERRAQESLRKSLATELDRLRREGEEQRALANALTTQLDRLRREGEKQRALANALTEQVKALRNEHDLRVRKEMLLRMQAERKFRITAGKLRRLRGRRWWRLAGALSRWRRQPWRIFRLLTDVWKLAWGPAILPPPPDVSGLDAKIASLRRDIDDHLAIPAVRSRAHRAMIEGDYEQALAFLAEAPERLRDSREGRLLARDCYLRLGEITRALVELRAALRMGFDPALARQARMLIGRLRETDTNWLPPLHPNGVTLSHTQRNNTVLHILKESLPFFERGYTMRSHMTLRAQQIAGFNPVVVTSLGFPREQGFEVFDQMESIDGIPHHRLDLGASYRLSEIPYDQVLTDQAILTRRLAEHVTPGVVQVGSGYRGYETALVALAVGRSLGVPVIYEMRSFLEHTWTGEIERSETGEYYSRRFAQETRCLREADFVVTIAEAMRDEIVDRGIDPNKVAVIPNVVDVERFKPRKKPEHLIHKYRLDDRFVLGYVSNLGQREGIDNLIRAVGLLRNRGTEVAGFIVGEGPEAERLQALITELGLDDDVVMTGHVPNREIEDHYALIDLFVVPRIDDRAARLVTPLKPLEAMAMGIPVMAADLPALRELVAPGERGLTFRPSDPEDLAAVASILIADDDLRSRFGTAARAWVLAERTLDANAQRYSRLLEYLLGKHQ